MCLVSFFVRCGKKQKKKKKKETNKVKPVLYVSSLQTIRTNQTSPKPFVSFFLLVSLCSLLPFMLFPLGMDRQKNSFSQDVHFGGFRLRGMCFFDVNHEMDCRTAWLGVHPPRYNRLCTKGAVAGAVTRGFCISSQVLCKDLLSIHVLDNVHEAHTSFPLFLILYSTVK